jgi:glycerophosphoryl diester phosphodiesterase
MKKKKRRIIILSIIAVLIIFMWANNTSMFTKSSGEMKFIAHRGLAQNFDISKVEADTNTAAVIYEPEYSYLENTIESMQISYEYGANSVEFDIQLTKDGQLACFHDYTLEYRTNGIGEISDYTMDELRLLDIGYGYTADDGETYPFRGQGIGLMPSIEEVFEAFPDEDLLIHIRSYSIETGEVLWSYLSKMSEERLDKITIYGSKEPVEYLREQCPTLRVMNKDILIKAFLTYEAIGWTGYIPEAIQNTELHLPIKFARLLWGWPDKFIERMESVNTRVVVVNGNGDWSEGFDSFEDLEKLPEGYNGYVWTNRIDKLNRYSITQ